jgi:phospholipid/cholesterol/gamma-HCH transport system permease protein
MMTRLLTLFGWLGRSGMHAVQDTGQLGLFLLDAIRRGISPPYTLKPIIRQIYFIGARSMLMIVIAGLFVGMVVALQFYDTLVRFGSVSLLGSAVGLSLIRELGPVLTALLVTGRAGSAICAELGIMRSDHQIDALDCMAIDPYRYLIIPRLLAGVISVPLLTALFVLTGIAGGYFIGVVLFGVSHGAYMQGMSDTVLIRDLLMCLIKSLVFGLLIVWFTSARGFLLHLDRKGAFGAEGVSRVTTEAVVLTSISILFADYLISALLL